MPQDATPRRAHARRPAEVCLIALVVGAVLVPAKGVRAGVSALRTSARAAACPAPPMRGNWAGTWTSTKLTNVAGTWTAVEAVSAPDKNGVRQVSGTFTV